ncbi:MAG: extracellular solute-binding protein [Lachnospiraceae bacterium]|nr:extracellular solute-binding protein [Lachnospiraceae bacterium]
MNRYFQKTAALVFCCTAVTLLTACSGSQGLQSSLEKSTEELIPETMEITGWEEYADTPTELDWYVNFSWFKTGWGENLVSKKITEETGVSINFVTPAGNESEKMNSMIASDTLPDLITLGWWEPQTQQMVEYDMVYPLNELADEYAPYFYDVIDEDTVRWYTKENGNLYCYPSSSHTPKDYEEYDNIGSNQNFLVRKDIYEALGCPDMTTPEGFAGAVRAAAEQFPEVDGYPLIPVGAEEFKQEGCNSFDKYLQNFLAVPYEKDGEAYDRTLDPEYISWLKVFRRLAQEGYLSDDIFVDRRTQIEEKIARGQYFCMIYQGHDMVDQEKILLREHPERIYMAVDGPKNSSGDDPTLPGTGINGWTVTFISKNCSHPERAIALLSYLISEHGQKMIYLGVEGEMYDMVDGEPVVRPEVQELLETNREEYDRLYGADDAYWMLQDNVMQQQWGQQLSEAERQIKEWTYPYTIYVGQYEINYEAGTEEANIYTKVQQEWGKTLPQLLLAGSDAEFDRILDSFETKREAYGYDKVMREMTRRMKLLKEKLGMA